MIRTMTKICSSTNGQGPQEGIDHLFLLPERVLGMDGTQLRKDLAALDFKVQLLQSAPSGNVWLSGGGNDREVNGQLSSNALNADSQQANAKSSAYKRTKERHTQQQQIDREERLRLIKERENEERQKKLEELKQQALAAKKFLEKTEEDRRRRIEDLRSRENDRRQQVEERKRMIMSAERDRREAILRRNMEREARIESKRKMERSSIVFAFGSSTPRMLDPTDSGNTYWGRRATSTMNVMTSSAVCPSSLTRRSSERELTNGSKKRATSAGGLLDRKIADDFRPTDSIRQVLYGDDGDYSPFFYSESSSPSRLTVNNSSVRDRNEISALFGEGKENSNGDANDGVSTTTTTTLTLHHQHQLQHRSAARRKTDLMPTVVPSSLYRETNGGSKLNSVCPSSSRRSPGPRSGETTPRPQSALSQNNGGFAVPSRQRPITAPPRRQRPISIAITGVTSSTDSVKQISSDGKSPSSENRPPVPKVHVTKKYASRIDTGRKTEKPKSTRSSLSTTPKETPLQSPTVELSTEDSFSGSESGDRSRTGVVTTKSEIVAGVVASNTSELRSTEVTNATENIVEHKSSELPSTESANDSTEFDMSGSMTSSQIRRITTEEEAKAALAERRRLAREQAEREAELEQQRLEAERLAEEERLRKEEEEQRKMEEEQLRLLEESKKAEEERLLQAIQETKKREEEERLRKEKELQLKLEKEEADRKAKEEAEKLRQETELKLKREEEERQARRKRVEMIMSRTRAKNGTPTMTPTKETHANDETVDDKMNGVNNKVIISSDSGKNAMSENEKLLASERGNNANENGSSETINPKQNGVPCSLESRNVSNNLGLLDLTDFNVISTNMIPSETVSSPILDIPVTKDNFNTNNSDITDLLS